MTTLAQRIFRQATDWKNDPVLEAAEKDCKAVISKLNLGDYTVCWESDEYHVRCKKCYVRVTPPAENFVGLISEFGENNPLLSHYWQTCRDIMTQEDFKEMNLSPTEWRFYLNC